MAACCEVQKDHTVCTAGMQQGEDGRSRDMALASRISSTRGKATKVMTSEINSTPEKPIDKVAEACPVTIPCPVQL